MAKYIMQSTPDLKKDGTRPTYPRLVHAGVTSTRQMAEALQKQSAFSTGDIVGLIEAMGRFIATETALGRSVRIDGIGTFRAALGLAPGKERETEDGPRRNAASVCVRSMHFRPDRRLIALTEEHTDLERARSHKRTLLLETPEARLAAALDFLDQKGFLRVYDYAALTGLSRTMASRELVDFHSAGLLDTQGTGTHKVYVKPAPPTPEKE